MPGRKKSHSEQWWGNAPATARRCKAALKKDGSQCRRVADLGSVVCVNHGALAPQVQRHAKETLMLHSSGMADMLLSLAYDPITPIHLRVKLAQDVLDRTGIDRSTTVQVGTDPLEAIFKQLTETPGALEEAHEDDDMLELESGAVYDAVVIEDDPLGDAFADAQRVVDPEDAKPVVQPMPIWMARSYREGGFDV